MSECEGQHSNCETCFPLKLRSIQWAGSAMPFRHPEVPVRNLQEKRLHADLKSYNTLVKQGVQPAATRGASVLEKCDSKFEIESGRPVFNKQYSKKVEKVLADMPKPAA